MRVTCFIIRCFISVKISSGRFPVIRLKSLVGGSMFLVMPILHHNKDIRALLRRVLLW